MYVYMYVFWYLILSSLVGKSYLSAQGLLYNYVVGTSSNSQEALADDIQWVLRYFQADRHLSAHSQRQLMHISQRNICVIRHENMHMCH